MSLIDDECDYIDQVFERSRRLIRSRIWHGIKENRLDDWLGCLRNFDAELLAAYLLDNLCFRSQDQYSSMLDAVFCDVILSNNTGENISLLEQLQKRKIDNLSIRIAPVIGFSSPPTKSGPYILRLAQRRFHINNECLTWPHLISETETISHLFFVDDFCGTGNQFKNFLDSIKFNDYKKTRDDLSVTYLVTTIHKDAISYLLEHYPYLKIKYTERLEAQNSVFSPECLKRYQVAGFSEKINQQYESTILKAQLPQKGKFTNGFGGLGLAYAFAHSTPNNTLPIFWKKTSTLTPLLDR